MKNVRISRWYLLLALPLVLGALALFLAPRSGRGSGYGGYQNWDLKGRYVAAETGYDSSSSHPTTDSNVGPPVFYSSTQVMDADGHGYVCGSADGFYAGVFPGGTNFGQQFYHGTYTIDSHGRVTIITCPDSAFCATKCTACADDVVTTIQVGYLASTIGSTLATAEQAFGAPYNPYPQAFSSTFLVHSHVWIRDPGSSTWEYGQ